MNEKKGVDWGFIAFCFIVLIAIALVVYFNSHPTLYTEENCFYACDELYPETNQVSLTNFFPFESCDCLYKNTTSFSWGGVKARKETTITFLGKIYLEEIK